MVSNKIQSPIFRDLTSLLWCIALLFLTNCAGKEVAVSLAPKPPSEENTHRTNGNSGNSVNKQAVKKLYPGEILTESEYLSSASNEYKLYIISNGNLCIKNNGGLKLDDNEISEVFVWCHESTRPLKAINNNKLRFSELGKLEIFAECLVDNKPKEIILAQTNTMENAAFLELSSSGQLLLQTNEGKKIWSHLDGFMKTETKQCPPSEVTPDLTPTPILTPTVTVSPTPHPTLVPPTPSLTPLPSVNILNMETGKTIFLAPLTEGANTSDFDFLASIPASVALTGGKPALIGVDLRYNQYTQPNFSDFFNRYGATRVIGVNVDPGIISRDSSSQKISANSSAELSLNIAQRIWSKSSQIVIASDGDYRNALMAAGLAAKLRVPLLYYSAANKALIESTFQKLETKKALVVGSPISFSIPSVTLENVADIISWFKSNNEALGYLAITNPADRVTTPDGAKLSLLAPILAGIRNGIVAPIDNATSFDTVKKEVLAHYNAFGNSPPSLLAIVGSASFIPLSRGEGDLVVDGPYGNMDNDPFLEMGVGRIIANNATEGSLIVSRISAYEDLFDGKWENTFGDSGSFGNGFLLPTILDFGYNFVDYTSATASQIAAPVIKVGLLMHAAHSNELELGHAYSVYSSALLAPVVVISGGCQTAGIDIHPDKSVVKTLLKNGAVAFFGATRPLSAIGTHMISTSLTSLLTKEAIGEAYKNAYNEISVDILDNFYSAEASLVRQKWMLIGDPGFKMHVPSGPKQRMAMQTLAENKTVLEIASPEKWTKQEFKRGELDEWKWPGNLYYFVGTGVRPIGVWSGRYNSYYNYYFVQLRTDKIIKDIVQESSQAAPVGSNWTFSKNVFVDEHGNGERTYLWRVYLLNADQERGEIKSKVDKVNFRINYMP